MTKYATTNSSGNPTGFYDTATGVAVPSGAIALTNAQFSALIGAPAITTITAGTGGAPATLGTCAAPAAASPTLPILAQLALGAGLVLTSTAHGAALNGTYALDTVSLSLAHDLAGLINTNAGSFPAGASTWSWPDINGTLHVFPNAASFTAFFQALAAYRLALFAVIWGATTSLPADAATIA